MAQEHTRELAEVAFIRSDEERALIARERFWYAVTTLYSWRRFIMGATTLAAIISIVVSLLLPKSYRAETRLLLPESGGGGVLSMLSDLPAAARSLIRGTGGGDYTRYIAILSSRSVLGEIVDEFNLVEVYNTHKNEAPRQDAIGTLDDRVTFAIDEEFEFLEIRVLDRDPQRAADIANHFVARLNEVNSRLASQSAAGYRIYVESRYAEAVGQLDAIQDSIQFFQSTYGVYDLPQQMEGFLQLLVDLRIEHFKAQTVYQTAISQYGSENERVRFFAEAARSADRQYRQALRGQEQLMPVPVTGLPVVARRYVDLERDRLIQAKLLEVIAPMVEHARFEEQKQIEAVQVIDPAIPPVKKAKPKRMLIVASSTLAVFVLSVIFALAMNWWITNRATLISRAREATGGQLV